MVFKEDTKDFLRVLLAIAAMFFFLGSLVLTIYTAGIFFVRGCVPTLTAASDKFAKSVVELMGEDFEEHSWKIDKKDGNEGTKEDDQNEKAKNVEQGSAGFEGA